MYYFHRSSLPTVHTDLAPQKNTSVIFNPNPSDSSVSAFLCPNGNARCHSINLSQSIQIDDSPFKVILVTPSLNYTFNVSTCNPTISALSVTSGQEKWEIPALRQHNWNTAPKFESQVLAYTTSLPFEARDIVVVFHGVNVTSGDVVRDRVPLDVFVQSTQDMYTLHTWTGASSVVNIEAILDADLQFFVVALPFAPDASFCPYAVSIQKLSPRPARGCANNCSWPTGGVCTYPSEIKDTTPTCWCLRDNMNYPGCLSDPLEINPMRWNAENMLWVVFFMVPTVLVSACVYSCAKRRHSHGQIAFTPLPTGAVADHMDDLAETQASRSHDDGL